MEVRESQYAAPGAVGPAAALPAGPRGRDDLFDVDIPDVFARQAEVDEDEVQVMQRIVHSYLKSV